MFVSAMYAAAFFESDPRRIVEAGLAVLPAASAYARLIADVLAWSAEHPQDWIRVWQLIDERWNRREPCPEGALRPFNIDAKLNGAYVALGLLYGSGDFEATMRIATRAGQDSDCNPASAAGWYLPTGGLADVYLDGKLVKTIDTYPDEEDVKLNEAVWHDFGLAAGEHEVRLVVRGEAYAESQGAEICLTESRGL